MRSCWRAPVRPSYSKTSSMSLSTSASPIRRRRYLTSDSKSMLTWYGPVFLKQEDNCFGLTKCWNLFSGWTTIASKRPLSSKIAGSHSTLNVAFDRSSLLCISARTSHVGRYFSSVILNAGRTELVDATSAKRSIKRLEPKWLR